MKLPAVRRFSLEDFPNAPTWLGKLFFPLNLILNTIYQGLDNGITVNDNMLGMIKTATVDGTSPTASFKWSFSTNPMGLTVINVTDTSGNALTFSNPVYPSWSYSQGLIKVNNITGLTSGVKYLVTFQVIGG